MKCKHGRELYLQNRICRECMAEREQKLLDALEDARKQIRILCSRLGVDPNTFSALNELLDD